MGNVNAAESGASSTPPPAPGAIPTQEIYSDNYLLNYYNS